MKRSHGGQAGKATKQAKKQAKKIVNLNKEHANKVAKLRQPTGKYV